MKPLVFVADAHLTRDDPEVDTFVSFLRAVGPESSSIVILGDLFNLWLGRRRFSLPHHDKVLAALTDLKQLGVRLVYVEGNRDFHLRRNYLGDPFDAVAEDSTVESYQGWRVWATHGDAINLDDKPYKAWKAFSKSAPVYGAFSLLPGAWGMRLGERLERKLTGTNIKNKSRFPVEHCHAYAEQVFARGCHTLVMGHFHEELHLEMGEREGRPLGVFVLPAWRHGHRYLVLKGDGPPTFTGFGC
jgi:UDP-2,3-diacylglucosamine hydrolase